MKPFHRNPFGRFCRFLIVLCCLGVFLPACSSQGSGGLFSYAVDSSGSTLSPKTVKFNMTPEEVRSAAQIPGTDLDTTLGEDHPRIIRSIEIPGLSDTVQEIFSFQDNRLVAVEYAVTVPESAFEKALAAFADQAPAALPSDLLLGENRISQGKTTQWEDAQSNTVTLSFPETNAGERVILLGLYLAKN